MPYEISRLGDEPIIIAIHIDPIKWGQDSKKVTAQVASLAAEIDGWDFRITDLTKTNVTFSELMIGLAAALRSEGGWQSNHQLQPVVVAKQESGWEFQTFATEQEICGKIHVEVVSTLNKDIAYARTEHGAEELHPFWIEN